LTGLIAVIRAEHHSGRHVLPGDDQRRGRSRTWVENREVPGFVMAHSGDRGADKLQLEVVDLPSLGPSGSVQQ
jgi:hypothetical protein